jgi:hypothetical protein
MGMIVLPIIKEDFRRLTFFACDWLCCISLTTFYGLQHWE